MVCHRFLVSGRVQGVGFRNFVQTRARALGVRGAVRNLGDGRVEILAQAQGPALDEFRLAVLRGPSLAHVTALEDAAVADPARVSGFRTGSSGMENDFFIVADGEEPWSVDS
jgi:acylphosphatase